MFLSQKIFFSLDMLSYLPKVSYASFFMQFQYCVFPKEVKLLGSGTPALASVHILSTDLDFCTSVCCCVILAVNLRMYHYAKYVSSSSRYGLILKSHIK